MSGTQFVVRVCPTGTAPTAGNRAVWIYPKQATTVPQVLQQLKDIQEVNAYLTADEVEQMQDPVWHGPSLVVHSSHMNDTFTIQSMGPRNGLVESTADDETTLGVESSRLVATHPAITTYYVRRLVLSGFSACLRDFDVTPLVGVLPFRTLCVSVDLQTNLPSEVPDCAESLSRLVKTIGGLTKIQVSSTDFNLRIVEKWLGDGGDGFSGEIEVIDVSSGREPLTWATSKRVLTAIHEQHQWLVSHYSENNNNTSNGGATTTTPSAPGDTDGETNVKCVQAWGETQMEAVSVLTISTITGCPDPRQAPLEFTSMLMKISGLHPSFQVRFPFINIMLNAVDAPCVPPAFTLPRWRDILPQLAAARAKVDQASTSKQAKGASKLLGLYICGRVVYCEAQIILKNSGLVRRMFADVKEDEATGREAAVSDKDEDGVPIVPLLMDRPVALHTVHLMVCFLTECVLEAAEDNPANHERYKKKSRNLALFTDTMLGDSVREKKLDLCELIGLATYLDIDVLKHYARVEFLRLLAGGSA